MRMRLQALGVEALARFSAELIQVEHESDGKQYYSDLTRTLVFVRTVRQKSKIRTSYI